MRELKIDFEIGSDRMNSNLFEGDRVRLFMAETKDAAEAEARWLGDSEFMRLLDSEPPRLRTAQALQTEWASDTPTDDELVVFNLQAKADGRLIGFIALDNIHWNHSEARAVIGIGEREYRGKGYGPDAMRVLLRYAFTELNLHRVGLEVFGYNTRAIRAYEKVGFIHEGRQRRALHRDGEWADILFMGILKKEFIE
jgi:RimJ/RimL family protein N-acetyltransferase